MAESVITELAPIREKFNYLMGDLAELDRLLRLGAEQARNVSRPKLDEIKRRIGLTITDGNF